MSWTNYHSHTHFCDGKGKVKEYIQAAIEKGMPVYGISSHNPLPNRADWGMHEQDFENYLNEISAVKEEVGDQIEILSGLEVDYFPFIDKPLHWIDRLDYWIGSVHFIDKFDDGKDWEIDGSTAVFKKGFEEIFYSDIRAVVQRYYDLTIEMIEKWGSPILGHLDKIKIHNRKQHFFNERDLWYLEKVEEVLEAAKRNNTIIEVNTRGLYKGITEEPYPSYTILEMIRERHIPIMLNSDSHHVREMDGEFELVADKLKKTGFKTLTILSEGSFLQVEFQSKGIHLQ